MRGSESAAIEFRLLGPVEAVRNGSVLPLGGKRQRALLALLLLDPGRPVAGDRLAEELWYGAPPPGARVTLPSYVSRLRRALGIEISSSPAGYALEVLPEQVDATRFDRLVADGREALARRAPRKAANRLKVALDLWRGPPLADVGGEGALRLEAERLEELRVLALEDWIEAELQLGAGAELVEMLEALVGEHPYRERLWQHLMLALYRTQRQADALDAYQRAYKVLGEELGLEPSEELKALEQAILRHEVEPATQLEEKHNLPAPLSGFVGREQELSEIVRLLDDTRLLTLTGVGGVGKTRLALEAAQRALPDFPDGVYFVDLSPLADAGLVTRHAATALGVSEQGETPIDELLVTRLREGETLLLLDNCEHVREACAELTHCLLAACPRLRILATSREVLGASGEVDYAVPPLAPADAVELFLLRARAVRPQLGDDARVVATAADICSELDGLPLALELAAARAKALALDDIARRLADRFRFLVSWRRLSAARHRTLREAMDWSYELLSPEEQAFLGRLSVFAGGFTLQAAAAVGAEGDTERGLDLLEHLVHASLVIAEEHEREMRYRLLETVRQYANERLEETTAADAAREAHAHQFLDLVRDPYEVEPAEADRYLERLYVEHDNVRAALRWFEAVGDGVHELRLAASLWRFWYVRGYLAEGRRRLEGALSRNVGGDEILRARALTGLAGIAWSQNDLEAADRFADEALSIARRVSIGGTEFTALTVRVSAAIGRTELELAKSLCSEAEEAARRWFPGGLALMLNHRGEIARLQGRLDDAYELFEEGVAHAQRMKSAEIEAFALEGLADVDLARGDPERARTLLTEALSLFERLGFKRQLAECLDGLAAVERDLGNTQRAAVLLGAADVIADETGGRALGAKHDLHADLEVRLRDELGEEEFEHARGEGRRAPFEATLRGIGVV